MDIQVLQLMSDRKASNDKTLWDLESDSDVKSLLSGIREFNVSIDSVKTSTFINGLISDDQLKKLKTDEQKSEAYYNAAYNTSQQLATSLPTFTLWASGFSRASALSSRLLSA